MFAWFIFLGMKALLFFRVNFFFLQVQLLFLVSDQILAFVGAYAEENGARAWDSRTSGKYMGDPEIWKMFWHCYKKETRVAVLEEGRGLVESLVRVVFRVCVSKAVGKDFFLRSLFFLFRGQLQFVICWFSPIFIKPAGGSFLEFISTQSPTDFSDADNSDFLNISDREEEL